MFLTISTGARYLFISLLNLETLKKSYEVVVLMYFHPSYFGRTSHVDVMRFFMFFQHSKDARQVGANWMERGVM